MRWRRKPKMRYRAQFPGERRWRIGKVGQRLAPSFGWCGRCQTPWAFVAGHSTRYGDGTRGCFPLCEQCWEELGTPEARLPFYVALWLRWEENLRSADEATRLAEDWKLIEAAVLAEGVEACA